MDAPEKRVTRSHVRDAPDAGRPIAALKNNGNTCYLNSILYVLRFTSRFLHNLHHVISDAARLAESREGKDGKAKSASLGRNAASAHEANGARSSSARDLLSVGLRAADDHPTLAEKLHDVFVTLHNMEHASKRAAHDSYLPYPLLQALRDTNSIFRSDDQQDAHELLLYLFDSIRATCALVEAQQATRCAAPFDAASGSNHKLWTRLTKKKPPPSVDHHHQQQPEVEADVAATRHRLVEDFRGQTVRSTRCLECERVTRRQEQFFELAVPIRELSAADLQRRPSDLYREACLAPETLRGADKFYCDDCRHLNEAVRSVAFERLPQIMILQQKRFMHTGDGCDKVVTYMPTPLELECFCVRCARAPAHAYRLAGVVMHVGATMQSGHYKAYVAATHAHAEYARCASGGGGRERAATFFAAAAIKLRDRAAAATAAAGNGEACASRHCCGVRVNLECGDGERAWLECNDEKVRPISVDELRRELAYKAENTSTPYLLFYEQIEPPFI